MTDELAQLQEENQTLRDRVAWLENNFLGTGFRIDPAWHLTGSEIKVLRALMASHGVATRDQVMTAIYDRDEEPYAKIIDIFLCRMRKKLRPFGIEIRTIRGQGWVIGDETRALIEKAA